MSVGQSTRAALGEGCSAKTKVGRPCRAAVVYGTRFCALHGNPARAAILGRMGGRKNRHYVEAADKVKFAPPSTPEDIRNMLSQAMADVQAGRLHPRIASTLAYVSGPLLRAIESTDVQQRLARLEKELLAKEEKP